MKIRAIGTGSAYSRHPLVTTSFLVQSENSNVLIGCGPNIPAKLETINLHINQIDMFVLLNTSTPHVGGLEEAGNHGKDKPPYLIAPGSILSLLDKDPRIKPSLKNFETRAVKKVTINEEHFSETALFVDNYFGDSFGLYFEESTIFITGYCKTNDDFLHHYGATSELIFHECSIAPTSDGSASLVELQALPVYIQKKIWLCGYENSYLTTEDPLPMLFLPQGTCVYDSDRKEKHLDKERFIRENSKRQLGNVAT